MAATKQKRPRASNGRFVKRTRAATEATAATTGRSPARSAAVSDQSGVVRHRPTAQREGSIRLAILTLAILLAAIGFALPVLWIGSLVLMGVLWGAMIAERPRRQATVTGLVTEMVTAVVDEAKDVVDPGAGPHSDAETPSPDDEDGRRQG
jgi:hypothetical protein